MAAAGGFGLGLQGEVGTRGNGHEHLFLAVNQSGGIVAGDLKTVTVSDGVGGACLDAKSAKNAAVIVDVVNLGVALAAADAEFVDVLGSFNVDAVGRARRPRIESRLRTSPAHSHRAATREHHGSAP